MSLPTPEPTSPPVDGHGGAHLAQRPRIERLELGPEHATVMKEVIGDEGRRVERLIVEVPVLDDLDRGHAGGDGTGDVVRTILAILPVEIPTDSHRDLALHPEPARSGRVEAMVVVPDVGEEHRSSAGCVDAEVLLHDRCGAADLPPRLPPKAARLKTGVDEALHGVPLGLARGPERLG
ncbi:MAG: hypothetical protein JWO62_2230 [Acidimicrobiaceae bacterium]|nr:hypothetical protein [Acidimicrobiaceae bacterium]